MKYKDYYKILGVERGAGDDTIKKSYRKLARKYHPDVSKEKHAEEKFKEVQEAYEALKDPEKRKAYDQMGSWQPGQDFRPPPGWEEQFRARQGGGAGAGATFHEDLGDIDLADLLAGLGRGGFRAQRGAGAGGEFRMPGQDYEANVQVGLDDLLHGTEIEIPMAVTEQGQDGARRRATKNVRIRVPKGASDGQRMRVRGKGGEGYGGGPPGDLYLNVQLRSHDLYQVNGHDLYLEVPVTPWEAALGAAVDIPTPQGKVTIKVPPGSRAGQKLRVRGKGLPKPKSEDSGDLYAVLQIVTPTVLSEREKELYRALGEASTFSPRDHWK